MVKDRDVTRLIVAYFTLRSSLCSGHSRTGAQLEAAADGTTSAGGRPQGDEAHVRLGDLARALSSCDADDMHVLAQKYWCSPRVVDVDKLVPGQAGKMVLVSCREAQYQSDADCAQSLGLKSEHVFRRKLKAVRRLVRDTMQALLARRVNIVSPLTCNA